MNAYTEDTLVQQTTAEYLEQELGWESVYAYNNEDFGPDSLLGRESDREVVLTRTLRAKIEELNSGLPTTAYDDAVRQIVTVSTSQTMAATNREKYELIKDGVQVTFRNAKGERIRQSQFPGPGGKLHRFRRLGREPSKNTGPQPPATRSGLQSITSCTAMPPACRKTFIRKPMY